MARFYSNENIPLQVVEELHKEVVALDRTVSMQYGCRPCVVCFR
jgi:hypothetical protein